MHIKQNLKAFTIALLNFIFPATWGRRQRCRFKTFKSFKHPLLVRTLGWFFDVRVRMNGNVEIWFREKNSVIRRRNIKRFKHLLKSYR